MWEHGNDVPHDTQLEGSCQLRDAEMNNAITKLYKKVDTYSAED
jgi:hypothetical protein